MHLDHEVVKDEKLKLAKGKRYLVRVGSKNRQFAYLARCVVGAWRRCPPSRAAASSPARSRSRHAVSGRAAAAAALGRAARRRRRSR